MTTNESLLMKTIPGIIKIIFIFCAFYFFLMGISLVFLPGFLLKGIADSPVNPTIIGILRGAGGSIIPYSLLYIFIALDPFKKFWAVYVILLANTIAVTLDLGSVLTGEFKVSNAMIDLPVELVSIIGVILIFLCKKKIKRLSV